MRTNIDIDDDLLSQAAQILGTTTKKSTVEAAFRELIRQRAMRDLLAMAGTVDIDMNEIRPGWEPSRQSRSRKKVSA
jgi:Arc/MetJ family transcription regulator